MGVRPAWKPEDVIPQLFYEMTLKAKCGGNTDYKFPTDAGFVYDKTAVTAAVLRANINKTSCRFK